MLTFIPAHNTQILFFVVKANSSISHFTKKGELFLILLLQNCLLPVLHLVYPLLFSCVLLAASAFFVLCSFT